MESKQIDTVKFALIASAALLALPTFFWLGVFFEVFFELPFIVEHVMLPVDRVSPALTIIIMVGLPLISIMINLKSMMNFHFSFSHDKVEMDVQVRRNALQWTMVMYAAMSIIAILTYAFFENFEVVSRNFS